jgi:hypothetical protein
MRITFGNRTLLRRAHATSLAGGAVLARNFAESMDRTCAA